MLTCYFRVYCSSVDRDPFKNKRRLVKFIELVRGLILLTFPQGTFAVQEVTKSLCLMVPTLLNLIT